MTETTYNAGSIVQSINDMRKALVENSTLLQINREEMSAVRGQTAKIEFLQASVDKMGNSLEAALQKASISVDRAITVLEGHRSVSLYSHLITTGVLSAVLVIMALAFTRLDLSVIGKDGSAITIKDRGASHVDSRDAEPANE